MIFVKKFEYSDRIYLTEENDSVMTFCEGVMKELSAVLSSAVNKLNIINS